MVFKNRNKKNAQLKEFLKLTFFFFKKQYLTGKEQNNEPVFQSADKGRTCLVIPDHRNSNIGNGKIYW